MHFRLPASNDGLELVYVNMSAASSPAFKGRPLFSTPRSVPFCSCLLLKAAFQLHPALFFWANCTLRPLFYGVNWFKWCRLLQQRLFRRKTRRWAKQCFFSGAKPMAETFAWAKFINFPNCENIGISLIHGIECCTPSFSAHLRGRHCMCEERMSP